MRRMFVIDSREYRHHFLKDSDPTSEPRPSMLVTHAHIPDSFGCNPIRSECRSGPAPPRPAQSAPRSTCPAHPASSVGKSLFSAPGYHARLSSAPVHSQPRHHSSAPVGSAPHSASAVSAHRPSRPSPFSASTPQAMCIRAGAPHTPPVYRSGG